MAGYGKIHGVARGRINVKPSCAFLLSFLLSFFAFLKTLETTTLSRGNKKVLMVYSNWSLAVAQAHQNAFWRSKKVIVGSQTSFPNIFIDLKHKNNSFCIFKHFRWDWRRGGHVFGTFGGPVLGPFLTSFLTSEISKH